MTIVRKLFLLAVFSATTVFGKTPSAVALNAVLPLGTIKPKERS